MNPMLPIGGAVAHLSAAAVFAADGNVVAAWVFVLSALALAAWAWNVRRT